MNRIMEVSQIRFWLRTLAAGKNLRGGSAFFFFAETMDREEIIGLGRERIGEVLKAARRTALYDLIYRLATDPPQFRTETVARNRELHPRTLLRKIDRGELEAHAVGPKDYRISLPQLQAWDKRTELKRGAAAED